MKSLTFTCGNRCVPATLGLLLVAGLAQAATIPVFSTGVDAGGVVLANGTIGDPHYSLITVPGGTTTLRIATSANGYPIGPWVGDDSLSRWIGPDNAADFESPTGTYEYRTFFDLTGLNPATASLSGFWATDDPGTDILINGVSTGNTSAFYTSFSPFTISSGFIAGQNELIFRLNNGVGPSGLRVQISGEADPSPVPEPGAMLLLGTGLVAVGLVRRRYAGSRAGQ